MRKRIKLMWIGFAAILAYVAIGLVIQWPNLPDPDRLKGPVRSVVWEGTLIDEKDGQFLEGERYHIETSEYDNAGHRVRVERFSEWGCDDLCPVVARYLRVPLWPFASSTVRSYDSSGNTIQILDTESPSRKWLSRYEYDSRGNWIRKSMSIQDPKFFRGDASFIPREVHYRTIDYYQ